MGKPTTSGVNCGGGWQTSTNHNLILPMAKIRINVKCNNCSIDIISLPNNSTFFLYLSEDVCYAQFREGKIITQGCKRKFSQVQKINQANHIFYIFTYFCNNEVLTEVKTTRNSSLFLLIQQSLFIWLVFYKK